MAPTRPLAVARSLSWRWTRPTGKVRPALAERETGFFLSPVAPLPAPSVPWWVVGGSGEKEEAVRRGSDEREREGGRRARGCHFKKRGRGRCCFPSLSHLGTLSGRQALACEALGSLSAHAGGIKSGVGGGGEGVGKEGRKKGKRKMLCEQTLTSRDKRRKKRKEAQTLLH